MRRVLALVLVGLLLPAAGAGDDPPPEGPWAGVVEAARTVADAVERGDQRALETVASGTSLDPWAVAYELCGQREFVAAKALAERVHEGEIEGLLAYVAARRSGPGGELPRGVLARIMRLDAEGAWRDVLEAVSTVEADPRTVSGNLVVFVSGRALLQGGRPEASADAYQRCAEGASALGWRHRAAQGYQMAGQGRAGAQRWSEALEMWEHALRVLESAGIQSRLTATVLHNLGFARAKVGDRNKACAWFERSRVLCETLGDEEGELLSLLSIGTVRLETGDAEAAAAATKRALKLAERLGDRARICRALLDQGVAQLLLENFQEAREHLERAVHDAARLGDGSLLAEGLLNLGAALGHLGESEASIEALERALDMAERSGAAKQAATALGSLGVLFRSRGDHARAGKLLERARRASESIGDREATAKWILGLGQMRLDLGDAARALRCGQQAHLICEEIGDRTVAGYALALVGGAHRALGDYAAALATTERALRLNREVGSTSGAANSHLVLGSIHHSLGRFEEALVHHRKALELAQTLQAPYLLGSAWNNVGSACSALGRMEEALDALEQARAIHADRGADADARMALQNVGITLVKLGRHAEALTVLEDVAAEARAGGRRAEAAMALGNLGWVHARLGHHEEAEQHLERSVREARRLRQRETEARGLASLAVLHLEQGRPARALMAADRAMALLETLVGGLGEEEGASGRGQFSNVLATGALAAARIGDEAAVLTFLESGRAGSLLETLSEAKSLRYEDLPEDLAQAEVAVRSAEVRARRAVSEAVASANRVAIRKARAEHDVALGEIRAVSARIQREAKHAAGLLYPRAATLEEVQGWLDTDEALVLYGLCRSEALALVVTQEDARLVDLGSRAEVGVLCADVDPAIARRDTRGPLRHAATPSPGVSRSSALVRLREAIVEPLHLGAETTSVLVSPEGPLCYLPWGALLMDRTVTVTPSGTTHVLLMEEEREPGTRVLALGDPAYGTKVDAGAAEVYRGGAALSMLPATRSEAEAIGDVTLLGEQANEVALREALTKQDRWRAVHFACHGLVDPEHPTLSSLALVPAGDEDGFLTALEVLRMDIPADLVALSACETAKGKIMKGEGIVGLTRAFMYAGTPRVLCSLWKVDDEATAALMTKFYALWNPRREPGALSEQSESNGSIVEGLGAAEALKQAQVFVRNHPDHQEWKDPYYWAAWVLWGLPK